MNLAAMTGEEFVERMAVRSAERVTSQGHMTAIGDEQGRIAALRQGIRPAGILGAQALGAPGRVGGGA